MSNSFRPSDEQQTLITDPGQKTRISFFQNSLVSCSICLTAYSSDMCEDECMDTCHHSQKVRNSTDDRTVFEFGEKIPK